MENAIFHFPLAGKPVSCEKYGFGHINYTFLVVTDQGKRYILQGINGNVFPNVRGMMENIAAVTRKALCVIDLDTVMPGLAAYDFGDSIRFGAATAAEDEKDLDKMSMDLELYRTFVRGFIRSCPSLTEKERETLPLGAMTMTLECGLRFLTDYLDGDHYFAIHRPEHNLDRARTQFKLVRDMEAKWEDMCRIIREETPEDKG